MGRPSTKWRRRSGIDAFWRPHVVASATHPGLAPSKPIGASWRASKSVNRRYDPVFASEQLVPIEATYGDLEQIRATGLSEHAPLRVMFGPALDPGPRAAPTHETPRARHVPEAPTLPVFTSREATSRQETTMPMADDIDLHDALFDRFTAFYVREKA